MEHMFRINGRNIGPEHKPYLVAELSGNHNQRLEQVYSLMDAAKGAGADAVKLQTYTANSLTIRSRREEFIIKGGTPWDGQQLYDLYERTALPSTFYRSIFDYAKATKTTVFSSPFHPDDVELLESYDCPAYKLASFETGYTDLIDAIVATGKPIIASTGMCHISDIIKLVGRIKRGNSPFALLHCVSSYPCSTTNMHVKSMVNLKHFTNTYGLSDHSRSDMAATLAVALGASIVEKHFMLSRKDKGPDVEFSLVPLEFRILRSTLDIAHDTLGTNKNTSTIESASIRLKRSWWAVKDIGRGEPLTRKNIRFIRPAGGTQRASEDIIGHTAMEPIKAGTPVTEDLIYG